MEIKFDKLQKTFTRPNHKIAATSAYSFSSPTINVLNAHIYSDDSTLFDCKVHVAFNITILLSLEK